MGSYDIRILEHYLDWNMWAWCRLIWFGTLNVKTVVIGSSMSI